MLDSFSESILTGEDSEEPFCGNILLELVEHEKHQTYLSFDDRTLTSLSVDDAEIGSYEAQLHVYLEEYPDIAEQVNFNVIISPCQVAWISLDGGPEDTKYAISTEEKKLLAPSLDQGVCQYQVSY